MTETPPAATGATSSNGRESLYQSLDWALVRAPLLPVEAYLALGERAATDADGSLLPAQPDVRRALAVGSPDLFRALQRATPSSPDAAKLRGKSLRYLIRMSSRPTPYGLFAGVALASWGQKTDLCIAPGPARTRTRPDMEWLLDLVSSLEAQPAIRRHLRFMANPSAFVRSGRVFLSERPPGGGGPDGQRSQWVSVRATGAVREVLAAARAPIGHEQLVTRLLTTSAAAPDRVERLVTQLWEQGLLITDLRPPLTGDSPARYVINRLDAIPATAHAARRLRAVLDAMAAWDTTGGSASDYLNLIGAVEAAHSGRKGGAHPPQVDMLLPLEGRTIASAVAIEAARAAELLLRLTPLPRGLPQLDGYRHSFVSRYGPEREVPLLELLDPNFGLGPPPNHGHVGGAIASRERQQTLRDLAIDALRSGRHCVELDDATISRLETWSPNTSPAPISLDLNLFVVASSAGAVDSGDFLVVIGPNLGATAAARSIGRFTDLLGAEAIAALRTVDDAERAHAPGHVRAELVYLPRRARSANVTIRLHARPYEIAVGATPGVPLDRIVPVDELVVGLKAGRLCVRWPRTDKEVQAVTGHMLNNFQAPDVCRFLDDVRNDGVCQLSSFDWGPAADFPFLPRVQRGKVVLSPARWLVRNEGSANAFPATSAPFRAALDRWRSSWKLPRHVYLAMGDNRLLLDLDDPEHVEELRSEIRALPKGVQVVLQEAIPGPGDAWATGQNGHFITELVVPLVLRATSPGRAGSGDAKVGTSPLRGDLTARTRPPGSEWLYAKLYCPRVLEEDLLSGPIAAFCAYALLRGLADEWFFIRYADPDPHIRLRFRGRPEILTSELFPQLSSWAAGLIAEGTCTRFLLDTYEREIERFGGAAGTTVSEAIFAADSRAAVDLLRLSNEGLDFDRTALAVLSIDHLLADLGLTDDMRLEWYKQRVPDRAKTGTEYRQRKQALRALLGNPDALPNLTGTEVAQVLDSRSSALTKAVGSLDSLDARGELTIPKRLLYQSFVHLHCNRLFGGGWSGEEQVLGLLARTREGLARAPLRAPSRGFPRSESPR